MNCFLSDSRCIRRALLEHRSKHLISKEPLALALALAL